MLSRFGWSFLVVVGLASPGWADSSTEGREQQSDLEGYLATGDSVPFGFNPLLDFRNPRNFVGYPQQVRDEVDLEPYLNTACPGETSGSFLSPSAPDNGCRSFKAQFPLHDGFHPDEIQVVRDVRYLLDHRGTQLVTVMLGANDLILVRVACLGDPTCIQQRLPAALQVFGRNLAEIYSVFRAAGFHGRLVGVQYYSTDYRDPLTTAVVFALNQVIADVTHAFGGSVADAFTPFFIASQAFHGDPCAAGLLIQLPTGGCDIHPSAAGRNLLANAVESVLQE
jgi:lysophospholipase L1-like esterase